MMVRTALLLAGSAALLLSGSGVDGFPRRQLLRPRRGMSMSSKPDLDLEMVSADGATATATATLAAPPGRSGFLMRLRETIAYLKAPEAFLQARVEEFGPVFSTWLFFRRTVVVGGPSAVKDFTRVERDIVTSSLPDIFTELHTPYGLLNLQGEDHAWQRTVTQPFYDQEFLQKKLPLINERMDELIESLAARGGEIELARELKTFFVQLFGELYSGEQFTAEEVELFFDYNAGLLSLSKRSKAFKKAIYALDTLRDSMGAKIEKAKAASPGDEQYAGPSIVLDAKYRDGTPWKEEHKRTCLLLNTWGAYVETASLLTRAVVSLTERPAAVEEMRTEAAAWAGDKVGLSGQDLPYTTGVMRESNRLNPPNGGGFRLTSAPVEINGYEIPEGAVVTADPRIGNLMPELFPKPDTFEPRRWMRGDEPQSSGCPIAGTAKALGVGEWFPGGVGAHKCPGVPTAELMCKVFLAKWVQRFSSWDHDEPSYEVLPIKIPKDDFKIRVTPRV